MSQKLQPVRGTHDILPEEFEKFQAVIKHARGLAMLYGFQEMTTPIFEPTEVFSRSLGDTSDIVHKEMFTFQTKGEESVTLRPEFTAGIVRAFISNGMQQHLPLKLFSTGPLFRYERPQKGRQRQFHQVNYEWLGDGSPEADVEIIMLAGQLLYWIAGKEGCKLLINTLGDAESRARYREALVNYLTPYAEELSEDSQRRLSANPLRILDSKSVEDQKILQDAPKITSYLSNEAQKRFDLICRSLNQKTHIPYFADIHPTPSLVRGLDYYTDTVFEFVSESSEMGAQNTVLAGGRYDGLVEQMGGKATPAIGFAAGIERLLLLLKDPASAGFDKTRDTRIVILPFVEEVEPEFVFRVAELLRLMLYDPLKEKRPRQQDSVEIAWQGNLKKRMEKAAQRGASHVVILGAEEVKRDACVVRNMETREQREIAIGTLSNKDMLSALLNIPL